MRIYWNEKSKATSLEQTIQFKEINPKVLGKERRLKRYQHKIKQYRQNRISKNNKREFYQQVVRRYINNWMQRKQNNLGAKYGNRGNIRRPKGKNTP